MRECPRCELCFEDNVEICPQDQVNTKATLPGPRMLASRYLLEKRLGRGAMGQVYLARDQNLMTRQVAVKRFDRTFSMTKIYRTAKRSRVLNARRAPPRPFVIRTSSALLISA